MGMHPDAAPQTPHATTNATNAFLTMAMAWRLSPRRCASGGFHTKRGR